MGVVCTLYTNVNTLKLRPNSRYLPESKITDLHYAKRNTIFSDFNPVPKHLFDIEHFPPMQIASAQQLTHYPLPWQHNTNSKQHSKAKKAQPNRLNNAAKKTTAISQPRILTPEPASTSNDKQAEKGFRRIRPKRFTRSLNYFGDLSSQMSDLHFTVWCPLSIWSSFHPVCTTITDS